MIFIFGLIIGMFIGMFIICALILCKMGGEK